MAKGLRASSKKSSRAALRVRVFEPVNDARTERLSAKLLELASEPRQKTQNQDLNMQDLHQDTATGPEEAMELSQLETSERVTDADMVLDEPGGGSVKLKRSAGKGRVQKRRRVKASSSAVFPARQKHLKGSGRRKSKK